MKQILLFLVFVSFLFAKENKDIVIATGSTTGNYYQVGLELNRKLYNNEATVLETEGSVENIMLLADKKADVAIVQGDALDFLNIFYSSTGQKVDDFIKIDSSAYTETLHIIVKKDSGITTVEQLEGKTVAYGGKKSGSSVTASYIEESFGLLFGSVLDVSTKKGLDLLIRNKVDVVFYVAKAPSNLLIQYSQHIRLLSVTKEVNNNDNIKVVTLPKLTYDFVREDMKTYGVESYIISAKDSTAKVGNVDVDSQYFMLKASPDTLKDYNIKYGSQSLLRLNYFNEELQKLQNEQTLVKLIKVNEHVNKLKFLPELLHWKTLEYWSSPLEFIGTGYGDTEEFALLKYLFLVKLGINPNNMKILQIDKPLVLKDSTIYEQNIVLAYYHTAESPVIILETALGSDKLYLLKDKYSVKEITTSDNPIWDGVFEPGFNEEGVDFIVSQFEK